tara:strand:+ start:457 stop:609 length:153 start_codon:yes stop_codon:yes gene_type:complete
MMYIKIKNHQLKKCLAYLDENPKWLSESRDVNGRNINYTELIELVWGIVK